MSFRTLSLHASLLRAVEERGFTAPTPIQRDAIPPALSGQDVLACAETGSGKTAAFLLPVMHRLLAAPRRATRALVLVPTRELAAQVRDEFQDLARHTHLKVAAVYGGVGHVPQERALRSGVDVVIATPGRLLDHLRGSHARFDQLQVLVLDEADRMLDMGFLPDIRRILSQLPTARQTLCFSATMPTAIRELTREMMRQPVQIQESRIATPPAVITQAVYPVRRDLKPQLLVAMITSGHVRQALVFTRTKHRANRLAELLVRHGIRADRIHGNRSQAQRLQALQAFKSGQAPVLVATDIVARGIDVDQLQHVVNFDVPVVPEDYVHRVGRTGRAQASGEAFTFASPEEKDALTAIERAIGHRLPTATLSGFDYNARPAGALEVPLAQRIAEIRARKARSRPAGARPAGAPAAGNAGRSRHGHGAPPAHGHSRAHGNRPGGGFNDARPRRRRRGGTRAPSQ